jgi:hypothetical protein
VFYVSLFPYFATFTELRSQLNTYSVNQYSNLKHGDYINPHTGTVAVKRTVHPTFKKLLEFYATLSFITVHKIYEKRQQVRFGFIEVILYYSAYRHPCGRLQSAKCKNTYIFIHISKERNMEHVHRCANKSHGAP